MVKTVADTPAAQPSAAVADLLTRGACASCHGANFSKPIDGAYPKLAGQHADYLFVALRCLRHRGQAPGRAHQRHHGRAGQAVQRAELKAHRRLPGSLPGELRTVPQSKFR